jgi:hypothetical protein
MTPAAVLAAGGGLYWLCKFNLKFKFIKFDGASHGDS